MPAGISRCGRGLRWSSSTTTTSDDDDDDVQAVIAISRPTTKGISTRRWCLIHRLPITHTDTQTERYYRRLPCGGAILAAFIIHRPPVAQVSIRPGVCVCVCVCHNCFRTFLCLAFYVMLFFISSAAVPPFLFLLVKGQ